jgi:hypothetical protein
MGEETDLALVQDERNRRQPGSEEISFMIPFIVSRERHIAASLSERILANLNAQV